MSSIGAWGAERSVDFAMLPAFLTSFRILSRTSTLEPTSFLLSEIILFSAGVASLTIESTYFGSKRVSGTEVFVSSSPMTTTTQSDARNASLA